MFTLSLAHARDTVITNHSFSVRTHELRITKSQTRALVLFIKGLLVEVGVGCWGVSFILNPFTLNALGIYLPAKNKF